jgi:hypothetical protein
MKKIMITMLCCGAVFGAQAQSESTAKGGFQKDKLFTGGSLSLGFGSGYFLGGVNPVLGYSLTSWLDAGIAVNYTFTQQKDISVFDDKARQSLYGGGVFTRIFPVRFLFAQAQLEHNFINFKYYPAGGGNVIREDRNATSLLVGPGYTTGRGEGTAYGFVSVLWDVMKNENSPYVDGNGRLTPQIRAGINIPLFQGGRNHDLDRGGPLKRGL